MERKAAFEVETGKELFVRRLHRAPVGVVNWSANGQRLLTAADEGTLRVYHFDTGETHTVLAGHAGPVRSAVWLNGSSGVASAGEDGSVRLWPTNDWTGALVHFRCVPWASGIDFDPTGRLLAMTNYIVRFDDGQEIEIPIQSGRHLDNWHVPAGVAADQSDGPRIAWLGENPASRKHGKAIALYLFTWKNPRLKRLSPPFHSWRAISRSTQPHSSWRSPSSMKKPNGQR
ncbi:MAG: hypothetical protein L0Z50_14550, partial [Verrucomicrobiales bacterium]|nr:hypothetical protein [Verrucomicrobiales bacterium]